MDSGIHMTVAVISAATILRISVSPPRSAAYFAASAAGAKETTSTRGSASRRCVTERAQEATPASAPSSGSPRNRKIPWGEPAPGRLGREDARNFGGGTLDRGCEQLLGALVDDLAPVGHAA